MQYSDPAHVHAVTTAGAKSYTYDANGNQLTAGTKAHSYDVENRLASVVNGTVTETYVYDSSGTRVKKITDDGSTTTETIYIGGLYEIDNGVIKKHIYAGENKVCSIEPEHTYYVHSDHLGSSNVITDENGNQASKTEYEPYGKVTQLTGQDVTPYKFTGKELDSTGLYFYGARYYDPEIGRFTQADTIVQAPFDPQTLNRYAYCRNNPLRYIDPSGHSFLGALGNALGSIGNAIGNAIGGICSAVGNFASGIASGITGGNSNNTTKNSTTSSPPVKASGESTNTTNQSISQKIGQAIGAIISAPFKAAGVVLGKVGETIYDSFGGIEPNPFEGPKGKLGYRPLEFSLVDNTTLGPLHHEQFFYPPGYTDPDGNQNSGWFPPRNPSEGPGKVRPDLEKLVKSGKYKTVRDDLHPVLLKDAQQEVKEKGWLKTDFQAWHDCQAYRRAVIKVYNREMRQLKKGVAE